MKFDQLKNIGCKRIVLERGVVVQLDSASTWPAQSSEKALLNEWKLRPILCYLKPQGILQEQVFLMPSRKSRLLDIEHSDYFLHSLAKPVLLAEKFTLEYLTGALIYHCKNLAEKYASICRQAAAFPNGFERPDEKAIFSGQSDGYYEFEALVTVARRTYDAIRYPIWESFGPAKDSVPRNFYNTLLKCTTLPPALAERLQTSWSKWGLKLRAYRDCLQHYVPLDFGHSSAVVELLDSGVWSTALRIPDNPEMKSRKRFQYEQGIDALSYGWELTNEILDVVFQVLRAVDDNQSD